MNYKEKLELLKKHSKNRYLISRLERKEMPEKLDYELSKVMHPEKKVVKPVIPPKVEVKVIVQAEQVKNEISPQIVQPENESVEYISNKLKIVRNQREINYNDLPRSLQILWDANRDAYKEIRSLHEKLKLMERANDSDREPLTMRIVTLDEDIKERWKTIDGWTPKPEPLIDHKRITSNRKFICVNIEKLKSGCRNPANLQAKIQERYDELVANGIEVSQQTIDELKKIGVRTNGTTHDA